jgi:cytochrome oxidase Cu insertion factor (SCO1/SenC/PrrC family)
VVVLSFIGTSEGNENDAEMLRRLAELGNALGPDLVDKVHLLTLVLADASGSPAASRARAAAPAVDVPWTFVRATPADAARLAASFGVVVWQYADGSIGHSFNTVIIDPAGRFVDQFPGLDPWSPRDVAAAAGLAAHR